MSSSSETSKSTEEQITGLSPFQQGVVDRLTDAADIFESRALVYKDNYRAVGRVMEALFPEGHTQLSQEDHNRWHLFELVIVKLTRYVNNYDAGGHEDSLYDMGVYVAMLGQLDHEMRERVRKEEQDRAMAEKAESDWEPLREKLPLIPMLSEDQEDSEDDFPEVERPSYNEPTDEEMAADDYWFKDWDGDAFQVGQPVQLRHHLGGGPRYVILEFKRDTNNEEWAVLRDRYDLLADSFLARPIWLRPTVAHAEPF